MKKVLSIALFLVVSSLVGCQHARSTTRVVVEARKVPLPHDVQQMGPPVPELVARVEMEIFAVR